ncbi:hypothetical protein PAGU2638_25310 [Lysobacter sp. PAGU 2638]
MQESGGKAGGNLLSGELAATGAAAGGGVGALFAAGAGRSHPASNMADSTIIKRGDMHELL